MTSCSSVIFRNLSVVKLLRSNHLLRPTSMGLAVISLLYIHIFSNNSENWIITTIKDSRWQSTADFSPELKKSTSFRLHSFPPMCPSTDDTTFRALLPGIFKMRQCANLQSTHVAPDLMLSVKGVCLHTLILLSFFFPDSWNVTIPVL